MLSVAKRISLDLAPFWHQANDKVAPQLAKRHF